MHIVHVVENLERGGLERVVIDLALLQRASGHTVEVVCLFGRGALAVELDAQGIPVFACGKDAAGTLSALRRMRQHIGSHGGCILHTHNAAAHYHAAIALFGIPFERVLNTRHSMAAGGRSSRRERFYRRSLWRTDAVVAVCNAARDQFEEQGVRPRGRLVAIPNGIPMDGYGTASRQARDALVVELGLPAGTRLIGTVGRLTSVKNQAMLLRAFSAIREAHPETALVVVGGGPLRAELESIAASLGIEERVRFLGDRGDVRTLVTGFDVFALSSTSEGYSIALLEASAAGVPIVATDVGGNREIVQEGRTGHLASDMETLAASIGALLEDPKRTKVMGENARAWAVSEASLETMAQRYAHLYTSVA